MATAVQANALPSFKLPSFLVKEIKAPLKLTWLGKGGFGSVVLLSAPPLESFKSTAFGKIPLPLVLKAAKSNKICEEVLMAEAGVLSALAQSGFTPQLFFYIPPVRSAASSSLSYIAMEDVGVNLEKSLEILKKNRSMHATKQLAAFAFKMLLALQYLTRLGIAHTDLKPPNIAFRNLHEDDPRITANREAFNRYCGCLEVSKEFAVTLACSVVKIMDMGSCKRIGDGATEVGTTAEHRSPRAILEDKIEASGDLFSLGTVVFEIYTGGERLFVPLVSFTELQPLSQIYLTKAFTGKPKQETLKGFSQATVLRYYEYNEKQKNYHLQDFPLPIMTREWVNIKLRDFRQQKRELLAHSAVLRKDNKEVGARVTTFIHRLLDTDNPPVVAEMLEDPFITFFRLNLEAFT